MDYKEIIGSLLTIKEKLDKEDYDVAIILLEEMGIYQLVNYLAYKETIIDEDKTLIGLIIHILQNIYNNSGIVSPINDELYDVLYEKYSIYGNIVGAVINNSKDKIISNHLYPDLRGTLQKTYFVMKKEKGKDIRPSIEEWFLSMIKRSDINLDNNSEVLFLAMPKYDGVSIIFECENDISVKGLTRGETNKNEATEIPFLLNMNFKFVNDKGFEKYGVKTEVIMNTKDFIEFKKKYGDFKSPRSAVASILNSKEFDSSVMQYLTIVPLQVQDYETKEVIIPQYFLGNRPIQRIALSRSTIENAKSAINNIKLDMEDIGDPIDGIVFRICNKDIRDNLGRDDAINKFEFAYKFPPEQKKTILQKVIFSTGVLGSITPVAIVDAVKISGNTITNISLGSIDRFESLDLHIGDEVIIKYDIIPYLAITEDCNKNISGDKINTPTICSYCNEKLVKDPILKCINNECESRVVGKIVNYLNKMNILNISIAIVETFYNEGYLRNIEDLYRLENNKKKLYTLKGFGKKSIDRILDSIEYRKDVLDYELLGSIGISDIGRRMFKKILSIYYIHEIQEISHNRDINKLISIKGIQKKTATKIVEGVEKNKDLINFLCSKLNVKREKGGVSNIKVCFTKIRDKEFENFLGLNNVEICDSFNKSVNYLIVPDKNISSSKVDKANKTNITVITLEEAYKLFKYRM